MNISVGGITSKLKNKADWVAFLVSAWQRYPNMKRLFDYYLSAGDDSALHQVMETVGNIDLLKYKLWDSPHAYTGLFKAGVFAYVATEFGILDKKWKKTIEKVLIGSGAAALTLPGSGPTRRSSGGGMGINPFKRS